MKGPLIAAALLIVAGLAFLLFPTVTNAVYERGVKAKRDAFEQRYALSESPVPEGETEEIERDPVVETLYQELVRRNLRLFREKQKNLTDAFAYSQPTVDLSEYGIEENTIGYLSIPKMDVVLPILLGANEYNMSRGAVHLTETSYPVGGENTNCVIAAHRGMQTQAMFRDIELLELGDLIYIENFRETLVYEVVELRVILPTDVNELLIQEGRDLVTLITCHPYGRNYQRYAVFCERVS